MKKIKEIKPVLSDELINNKLSFYSYFNGGDYRDIPKKAIRHKDYKALCDYYKNFFVYSKLSNYNLIPYAYDNRIGKYVMILTTDFENSVQQAICFVVVGKPYLVSDRK